MFEQQINDFRIVTYKKNEIPSEVVEFIKYQSENVFMRKRKNYNYKDNYIWDIYDSRTLAYKFFYKQFEMINLVFQNDRFLTFSGMCINSENIAFGGVRRFSVEKSPLFPYHMAYVIPIQLQQAIRLGARAFVVPYNIGVRDGFFKSIDRIVSRSSSSAIHSDAHEMYTKFKFAKHDEPVTCNSTLQRLHYCLIDQELLIDQMLKLIR